jgi:hypothetical protein
MGILAGSQPPAGDGEDGEEGYDDKVRIDQEAADVWLVTGDSSPVRGDGKESGDVEEGCPVRKGEESSRGEGGRGLLGATPQEPGGGGGYSGEEEEEDGGVVSGVRVPKGVEEVIRAPVEKERHDGSSEEDEGEEESGGKNSVHGYLAQIDAK